MDKSEKQGDALLEIDRLLNDPKFEKFNNKSYKGLYLGSLAMIVIAMSSAYLMFSPLYEYGFLLFIATIISMTMIVAMAIKNHNRSYPSKLEKEWKDLLELRNKIIENTNTETTIILYKAI